jgi:hypothetical protein
MRLTQKNASRLSFFSCYSILMLQMSSPLFVFFKDTRNNQIWKIAISLFVDDKENRICIAEAVEMRFDAVFGEINIVLIFLNHIWNLS